MQQRPRRRRKKRPEGTTLVLIIMAILDVMFTIAMIYLFYLFQEVPDALIVAVFGVTFGECGFCTLIYKLKKNYNTEVFEDAIHGQNIP